MRDFGLPQRSR